MRFILHLAVITAVLLVEATATSAGDDRSNDVPMLIYSRVKTDVVVDVPIGSSIDQEKFNAQLPQLFPSNKKKVAVIIAPAFEWADVLKRIDACPEIEKSEMYSQYPAVHRGYTQLVTYLQQIGVQQEPTNVDKLEDGMKLFCKLRKQKLSVYEGVVLTTLDNHDEKNDPHSAKHQRSARDAGISSIYNFKNNTDLFLFGDQCAALFNSIFIRNSTITSEKPVVTALTLDASKSEFSCVANATNATMSLSFTGGSGAEYITGVNLVFSRGNRGWKLTNSTVNTNMRELALTYMELPYSFETPFFYSIACTSARFKLSDPTNPKAFKQRLELYINGFQFQPFDVKNDKTSYKFGAVNYCGGFFTNGIWMGIATSLIMAAILAMGVYLMVTVNTMDRFDDPKGKPLPINAEK